MAWSCSARSLSTSTRTLSLGHISFRNKERREESCSKAASKSSLTDCQLFGDVAMACLQIPMKPAFDQDPIPLHGLWVRSLEHRRSPRRPTQQNRCSSPNIGNAEEN